MSSAVRVRVAIPHFFREGANVGYGSGRRGNRVARSLALARCLGSIIALNRASRAWILNHAQQQLEPAPMSTSCGLPDILVELHLFVCGDDWLRDVVEQYAPFLRLHQLKLDDPRELPLVAVRTLLDFKDSAALSFYFEDDLVIQDSHYVDKFAWFYERTDHRFVLMPHRREAAASSAAPLHLYVDGPTKRVGDPKDVWATDEVPHARVRFWDGQEISFVQASNPHSGSFCMSEAQVQRVRTGSWPPEVFVGPLETAATGTVRDHFMVLKPSWPCRDFLTLEHGNPSFCHLFNSLPLRKNAS